MLFLQVPLIIWMLMQFLFRCSDEGELDAPPPSKKPRTDSIKSVNRPEKKVEKTSAAPEAPPNALQQLMKGQKALKTSAAATAPSSSTAAAATAPAKQHVCAFELYYFLQSNGPLPE